MASPPIGVFDSGVGGLSVLRALRLQLPYEHFVYLADSGHAPYGERDAAHVQRRAFTITRHLLEQHAIKALVVACNTATTSAIVALRQHYPQLPLIGVEPALKPAALASRTGRVAVLATRGTLASPRLQQLRQQFEPGTEFILQPCDGLADAIELQCETQDNSSTARLCQQYLAACGPFGSAPGEIDQLVLGCTHYPFVMAQWQAGVGSEVAIVDTGAAVARHARHVLQQRQLLGTGTLPGRVQLISTGPGLRLAQAGQHWLGHDQAVSSIALPDDHEPCPAAAAAASPV